MFNAQELFPATPPVESLKYNLRRAASNRELQLMHIGVTRAFFYTDMLRGVYMVAARGSDRRREAFSAAGWRQRCTERGTQRKIGKGKAPGRKRS